MSLISTILLLLHVLEGTAKRLFVVLENKTLRSLYLIKISHCFPVDLEAQETQGDRAL